MEALRRVLLYFVKYIRTSTAVGTAHACWLAAAQKGMAVGVLAYDFSSAFDTVDPLTLLSKLDVLGVRGNANKWFRSYLEGGSQHVVWNDATSKPLCVKYGVRQGSILGPLLFITLMNDLPESISTPYNEMAAYADDITIWCTGDIKHVESNLNLRASAFTAYAKANALHLNASKTQLLLAGKVSAANKSSFSVVVDNATITPGKNLDFLGLTVDSKLCIDANGPAIAARHKAAVIGRLACHLPKGRYLSQLASGVLLGKIAYSAAAVSPVRLRESETATGSTKAIQVAINKAARSVTGTRLLDKLPTAELLTMSGLPSYNRLVVRSAALEAWKAFMSNDGPDGTRNPLGTLLFGDSGHMDGEDKATIMPNRPTRATTSGCIQPPLPMAAPSMAHSIYRIWNACAPLRAARTLTEAKKAAADLASSAPL